MIGIENNTRKGAEIGGVTNEGTNLIKGWSHAKKEVKRLEEELNRARCSLLNATNELGKWLVPSDANVGEKFAVWYGDTMIETTYDQSEPGCAFVYTISERPRKRVPKDVPNRDP